VKTGNVHLISLFQNALNGIENSTYIGAFNMDGNCIGFANITAKDQNVLLTVYGDDQYTNYKDGAESGELISFRAYDAATGLETILEAEYNESFANHDGLFTMGGLSAISNFKASSTGIGDSGLLSQISIYPNPAKETLNVVFENIDISSETHIELVNSAGSAVLEQDILQKHTRLNISKLTSGVYVLKIIQNGNQNFRKVVVQ
jgi:hypothetical protein